MNGITILQGDALEMLRTLPDESVNCVVTSPPYWGLRDYGIPPSVWPSRAAVCSDEKHVWEEFIQPAANGIVNGGMSGETLSGNSATRRPKLSAFCQSCGAWRGCLGLEPTPQLFVEHMVTVFSEVRRVLRGDGTIWVNMGDSYATGAGSGRSMGGDCFGKQNQVIDSSSYPECQPNRMPIPGLKPKDLVGVPWMLAFALRADGWYLRQDIIWAKPNPMPESVTDRCTKSHEYIFLLSKSERYYYNADAIAEPTSSGTHERRAATWKTPDGWDTSKGEGGHGTIHKVGREDGAVKVPTSYKGSVPGRNGGPGQDRRSSSDRRPKAWDVDMGSNRTLVAGHGRKLAEPGSGTKNNSSFDEAMAVMPEMRNKRSVWTVGTQAFPEAHFATFPEDLIKPCILAGCPAGGTVLDPFGGSGTTALVARANGCKAILIELNPEYIKIAERRLAQEHLDFSEPATEVGDGGVGPHPKADSAESEGRE